jgi:radical SAM superfamily enzyme YgiQ (UPF0313 family)
MEKIKVFLISVSSSLYDWLPYASGCLISHALTDPFIKKHFEFLEPEYRYKCLDFADFHSKLKEADIVGLSNWIWNQSYNDKISKIFKSYNKGGTVLYGGVNVPEDKSLAFEYAKERPYVDLFFYGPGEENFKNFLLNYFNTQPINIDGTFTGESYHFSKKKYQNLTIPTPYIDGIFDNILKNTKSKLGAVIETNRGCPYSCAFCDWGGMTRSKILKASSSDIFKTISYVASHENIDKVDLADANFGIFPEDVNYIKHFIDIKKRRKTDINLLMGGFAKNGSKYMEEIMELVYFNFDSYYNKNAIKISFQSHDPQTLNVINRSNIDNAKLYPMIERFQNKGINVVSEIIIGLPGDTFNGWVNTIQKNVDLKVLSQRTYILHVMVNTPLYDSSYKEKYKIKTKKILIPEDLSKKTINEYHKSRCENKPIQTQCTFTDTTEFESLEFVYECFSFDSEELIKIFDVWFWFNTFYNSNIARKEIQNDPRPVLKQFNDFMSLISIGEIPFIKSLLDDYRAIVWNTIIKPEPVTLIKDLIHANFLTKFYLRGNELVDIYLNKEVSLFEIQKLYKNITFDHFINQNVINLYKTVSEV